MTAATEDDQISVGQLLEDAPRHWGRRGDDDEVGSLDVVTPAVIVEGGWSCVVDVSKTATGTILRRELRAGRTGPA